MDILWRCIFLPGDVNSIIDDNVYITVIKDTDNCIRLLKLEA